MIAWASYFEESDGYFDEDEGADVVDGDGNDCSRDGVVSRDVGDGSRDRAGKVKRVTDDGSVCVPSGGGSLDSVGAVMRSSIVKMSMTRSVVTRRMETKDGVNVSRGNSGDCFQGSDSTRRSHSQVARLAKKVASLPKVLRAPLPVALCSEEVLDVKMDRQTWRRVSAVGVVIRTSTDFISRLPIKD